MLLTRHPALRGSPGFQKSTLLRDAVPGKPLKLRGSSTRSIRCALLGGIQKFVNRFFELVNRQSSAQELRRFHSLRVLGVGNTEKEARRSANVKLRSLRHVCPHFGSVFTAIETLLEFGNVQAKHESVGRKFFRIESRLIFE